MCVGLFDQRHENRLEVDRRENTRNITELFVCCVIRLRHTLCEFRLLRSTLLLQPGPCQLFTSRGNKGRRTYWLPPLADASSMKLFRHTHTQDLHLPDMWLNSRKRLRGFRLLQSRAKDVVHTLELLSGRCIPETQTNMNPHTRSRLMQVIDHAW